MGADFSVVAHGSQVYHESLALRTAVLRSPLGLIFSPEEIESEKVQVHLVGTSNDQVIATAILVPLTKQSFKIRQVAVHPLHQKQGLGKKMIEFAEDVAIRAGAIEVSLHSRMEVVPFYEKLGYTPIGAEFEEVGIPHLKMTKRFL